MQNRNTYTAKVRNLTLSALMSALSIVFMYVGSVIEVLDLTAAMLASMLCAFVVIEVGGAWPYLTYATVSVIGVLMLPNKFVAVVYIIFAGNYPMIKRICEKLPTVVQWLLKLSVFNLEFTLIYFATKYVFAIPDIGYSLSVFTYLICNAIFILYDVAMTKIISFYLLKLRKRLGIRSTDSKRR